MLQVSRGLSSLLVAAALLAATGPTSAGEAGPGAGAAAVDAQRLQAAEIDMQASLQEAHEHLHDTGAEALYVARITAPGIKRVYGILTPQRIEQAYRY